VSGSAIDMNRQIEPSAVHNKGSHLEHGMALRIIKMRKAHKIIRQTNYTRLIQYRFFNKTYIVQHIRRFMARLYQFHHCAAVFRTEIFFKALSGYIFNFPPGLLSNQFR
jgi:hypothetical protein